MNELLAITQYADRINACLRGSVERILEAGRLLQAAKDELPHGSWLEVVQRLPIGERVAQMFMQIAGDPRLLKPKIISLLPAHWSTIHKIHKLSDDELEARIADGTIRPDMNGAAFAQQGKAAKRERRERELAEKTATDFGDKKFNVILADCEWRFEPYSRTTGMDRAPENHYPTSEIETLKARRDFIDEIAAPDCALFLWATVPMLPAQLEVMGSWGFEYRSHWVWIKDKIGTGYWNRNKHELLLLGIKGVIPAPAPGQQWISAIEADTGEHSVKPEAFLKMIEHYFPNLPKIELNRRGPARPGWSAWGNEAESLAPSTTDQQTFAL